MTIPSLSSQDFSETLCAWQTQQGRHDLPWQQSVSAYRVLVSEMMLQQTQVKTVIDYFHRWMHRFPDLQTLAHASEDDVMSLWQGLGYYQRARRLQQAAVYLLENHQGKFPRDLESLLLIPGVGRYTAGAILSFAFDHYGPIVDGNVKRLFSRYFGIDEDISSSKAEKKLWTLAHAYTPSKNNRQFAQALLDLGSTVCKPKATLCDECPVHHSCFAFHNDCVSQLPFKASKKARPTKDGHFLWQHKQNQVLLEKRVSNGIWGALWCLPEVQVPPKQREDLLDTFHHTFSHYKLHAHIWNTNVEMKSNYQWFSLSEIQNLGLPAPIKKWIHQKIKSK